MNVKSKKCFCFLLCLVEKTRNRINNSIESKKRHNRRRRRRRIELDAGKIRESNQAKRNKNKITDKNKNNYKSYEEKQNNKTYREECKNRKLEIGIK